jgi:glucose-1-phosphate cytidylyltransferase
MTNDFVLSGSGSEVELLSHDLDGWRITFVDTGLHSNIGQRLLRVRKYVENDAEFLANYADGLSDLPLDKLIEGFRRQRAVASLVTIPSPLSFHTVSFEKDGRVTAMGAMNAGTVWINGGYFALRHEIFDYIQEGEELVEQPFTRLIERGALATYRHDGFWQQMDTFKDKITFDRMEARGTCPWMLWRK